MISSKNMLKYEETNLAEGLQVNSGLAAIVFGIVLVDWCVDTSSAGRVGRVDLLLYTMRCQL